MKTAQRLDILYVGTLPPHHGGSAIVADYLLNGLTKRGHHVRALAPITGDTEGEAVSFASQCPEISIKWFPVPHFSNATDAGSSHPLYRAAGKGGIAPVV